MQVPRWSNHARQVPAARPRPAGLARQVAHGDRSALVGLHDALAPDVLRTIRRRLPDAAESMSKRANEYTTFGFNPWEG